MERKIGGGKLALTFAGCFLGAGYVSGQELWQYFGAFGAIGLVGLVAALALLGSMSLMLLRLAAHTGTDAMDALLIRANLPWLRTTVGAVAALLLFGITTVMVAGIGALTQQMFAVPAWIGSAAAIVLTAACAYFGLGGMMAVFSVAVPFLVIAALAISGVQLHSAGRSAVAFTGGKENPMLGNWFTSAVNYAAFNFFASVGILAPLAAQLRKKSTAGWGVLGGGAILLLVALGVLGALATAPESVTAELPMLDLSCRLGTAAGVVYAVLLFLGMFGTAVSSLVAVLTYAGQKSETLQTRRSALLLTLAALAFAGSLFGFGDLIGVVYPVYGYLGAAGMLLVIEHAIHVRRRALHSDAA